MAVSKQQERLFTSRLSNNPNKNRGFSNLHNFRNLFLNFLVSILRQSMLNVSVSSDIILTHPLIKLHEEKRIIRALPNS